MGVHSSQGAFCLCLYLSSVCKRVNKLRLILAINGPAKMQQPKRVRMNFLTFPAKPYLVFLCIERE